MKFRGAGQLRHQVSVWRRARTQDATGDAVPGDPVLLCTAYAQIQPVSGREYFLGEQAHSETTHLIVFRWTAANSSLDADDCYVTFTLPGPGATQRFEVLSASNVEMRNIEWQLQCRQTT